MKKLIACTFAAASMAVLPMPAAVALDVAKVTCGPDVPEEWKRPGGYCEKIEGGSSLSGLVDCEIYQIVDLNILRPTDGLEVASLTDFPELDALAGPGLQFAAQLGCGEVPDN